MTNFKGFVGLTRAQYDALATKDPQKMYMITDEPPYEKPAGGIPASDMAGSVQASLGKADSALQSHQDISGKENTSNKVTSVSSASTNTQYPTAKCLYDMCGNIESLLEGVL